MIELIPTSDERSREVKLKKLHQWIGEKSVHLVTNDMINSSFDIETGSVVKTDGVVMFVPHLYPDPEYGCNVVEYSAFVRGASYVIVANRPEPTIWRTVLFVTEDCIVDKFKELHEALVDILARSTHELLALTDEVNQIVIRDGMTVDEIVELDKNNK